MAAVYRKKVAELVSVVESADVEARESARTENRVLVTKIVLPTGDAKLQVEVTWERCWRSQPADETGERWLLWLTVVAGRATVNTDGAIRSRGLAIT
jgi:hypothetical protein